MKTKYFLLALLGLPFMALAETLEGRIANLVHDDEGVKVVMIDKKTKNVRSVYLKNTNPDFIKMNKTLSDTRRSRKAISIVTSDSDVTEMQSAVSIKK